MNRERQLVRAFVALSDTYAAEFDPLHLFHRLVHTCQDLLDVDAAAVMIADARGGLRTMAATADGSAFADLLHLQNGHGPAADSYRTGERVTVPGPAASERWPTLAAAMSDAGYACLQALPMRVHAHALGALTLVRVSPEPFVDDDTDLTQALADLAALALVHWTAEPVRADDVVSRVQGVIAAKATLEIAKGMVAEYAGTTIREAARLLAAYADHQGVRLTGTAQALVDRTLELSAVLEGQPRD
ncbi:GAF domain-containing protein [Streptomyces sp. 4F14]|uniref:GAF domain-containing protein n=1 Tax=Streptomyces sp. 4F14 TaxID=3394380 RepID=UPI003A859C6A